MTALANALEQVRLTRDRKAALVRELDKAGRADAGAERRFVADLKRRRGDAYLALVGQVQLADELGASRDALVEASGLLASDVARITGDEVGQ